jgi:hypothetical protein
MKKYFGNKIRVSNYNPRKGNHSYTIKIKIVFSRVVDTQHREEVPTTVEIGKGNME